METRQKWTNPSVIEFAKDKDPVEAITSAARDVVVRAIDRGWVGPPFDPVVLADMLKLDVVPRADVPEARTVPVGRSSVYIEFNPIVLGREFVFRLRTKSLILYFLIARKLCAIASRSATPVETNGNLRLSVTSLQQNFSCRWAAFNPPRTVSFL